MLVKTLKIFPIPALSTQTAPSLSRVSLVRCHVPIQRHTFSIQANTGLVYGCLVGRLQATVRSFYGIEGTTTADWRDGWCCPCVTLDRIEHEVIIRERQHRSLTKLHAAESDVQDQYQPESPMSYMASTKSVPGQSNGKAPPDVGANPATITCCAPTPQTTNSAAVQQAFNNNHVSGHIVHPEHALTADHMQTMESTVSAHTLEHDTTSICRTHTPTVSHGIAEDIRLQTVTPMSVRSHDITQDGVWSKRMPTPGVSHDLDQDHFVPISRPNSTHPLSNHRMVAPMGLLRPSDGVNVMSSASLRGYPKASDKRRGERAHESCRGHETRG